jgi:glycosyltransferase involved in cell wall biosynthesis
MHTLGNLLKEEGYTIIFTSNKQNKVIRLLDMVVSFFKNKSTSDYVLIDTYSTHNFYYALVIAVLCKLFNKKYITLLHGGNLPSRLDKSPKMSKQIFKNAYLNISPSLYLKDNFEKHGYHNIKFVPNTIQIESYPFSNRDYTTIKLLWVRSFSKIYNPKMAVSVVSQLINQGYQAELCMVGPDSDGSLQEVQEYASQIEVEVTFTGKLTKQEWIALSKDYNIFINTTNFDNMPVSVIEAMALGLPVISTKVGGLPFLITDQEDGVLVNANDVASMANAIVSIHDDKIHRENLRKNARNKVEKFDWGKIKYQWLDVLQ